jgi:hypothetical protein
MTTDGQEYELEHVRYLAWERDSFNRLYYGLWIMFVGGFVLSLRVSIGKHFWTTYILIALFRVLAIVGTAVNFLMQYFAIVYLGGIREKLFYQAKGAPRFVKMAREKIRTFGPRVHFCETALRIIAVLFLLVALAGSFLVRVP